MSAHDLFFSYRRADLPRAQPLIDALTRTGINIWFDQTHIPDHAPITQEIRKAIAASKAFLAFYSRTYPDSLPCRMELLTAWLFAQHRDQDPTRRVLILNPESPDFRHIPPALRDRQSPSWPNDTAGFDELERRIHDHIGQIEGALFSDSAAPPRYFPVPLVSAQRFIGRETHLWELDGYLTDIGMISGQPGPRVAQIVGMPGNGKSLLAQEYAIRFGPAFPGGIFWINAFGNPDKDEPGADISQTMSREDQIRKFASQMRIPDIDDLEPKYVPAAFWKFLDASGKRCLWIVDDLASDLDRDGFTAWLPESGYAATLITTRTQSHDWVQGRLQLSVLTPHEAEQLLALHRAPRNNADAEALGAIARELGWHPLAVEVAGSYLAKGFTTVSQYLADLHAPAHPDDILEFGAQLNALLPTAHSRSIFRTFVSGIRQLGEEGQDFLRLASVLAAAPIPLDFIEEVLGAERFPLAVDQVDTLSLCERSGDDARAVHTLVSRTMRAFLARGNDARVDSIRESAVRVLGNRLKVVENIRTHESLSGAVAHARHLVSTRLADQDDARLAEWVARHDFQRAEFHSARALWEQVVETRRRVLPAEHPDTLTAMHNLGRTYRRQRDFAGARVLHEQVREARRRVLPAEHPDTLTSMDSLAYTLLGLGLLGDARELQEQALAARLRIMDPEHPDTLKAMGNMAEILRIQRDLAGARVLHEQTLEARRRVLGSGHPDTLRSMGKLAETLREQGDLAGARRLFEPLLEASRRVLSEEHPNTLTTMRNLAETLRALGDIPAAQALEDELARLRAGQRR